MSSSMFIYAQPDLSQSNFNTYVPLKHHTWDQLFAFSGPTASSWMLDETCPKVPQMNEVTNFACVLNNLISTDLLEINRIVVVYLLIT
ncbi:hypothetical protein SCLCIDRAFT_29289 [Scleroderma citrinum Foug A]|uniref:Uncharacterized protein n=1 Tax=Scleroderma citrinum Foug A TaxID=1036808 RepID=A0A0C3DKL3_9AGAM|nr:hypothetical protein SCLCIDRAFT_29289 [Scleroderma citrinum Foug A]